MALMLTDQDRTISSGRIQCRSGLVQPAHLLPSGVAFAVDPESIEVLP
jgi:hypothetical protein